jgi:hypothetical protein
MTDEELDRARAEEAWRLLGGIAGNLTGSMLRHGTIAARLAREDWKPGDMIAAEVRHILEMLTVPWPKSSDLVRAGLERGIEIGKAERP